MWTMPQKSKLVLTITFKKLISYSERANTIRDVMFLERTSFEFWGKDHVKLGFIALQKIQILLPEMFTSSSVSLSDIRYY